MQYTNILSAGVVAIAAMLPFSSAHAYDVVNTSVPTHGLLGSNTIDSSNWLAQAFTVSTTTQIDSVMAYLLSSDPATDLGKSFTLALYGNSAANLPSLNWWQPNQGQLFQSTVAYSGDGWNGATNLNWNLGAGQYWLAIEASGDSSSVTSLQAPTGALPVAPAVAYFTGGSNYVSGSVSDTFGLHITATPAVPEPNGLALALASLGILGFVARRSTSNR